MFIHLGRVRGRLQRSVVLGVEVLVLVPAWRRDSCPGEATRVGLKLQLKPSADVLKVTSKFQQQLKLADVHGFK